jgi:outer membrane protein assembly factor BamD
MQMIRKPILTLVAACAIAHLAASHADAGLFHKKKYENPISKDTLQPDKVLFDRSIKDIEKGRYEVARLTLNTLINTYDSSEYLAKAKLAIADSWYREGGAHGLAQAEAEYKDFELFYPQMEESSEAQWRVCQIHYKQMEKVDRDNTQALRAEDECRSMMTMYPNSRYAAQATQMLRSVQEVLAEKEFLTGDFYHHKGAFPAAENRLAFAAQQYPLFSHADDALWEQADSFHHMGDRFEDREAEALTKIVRDYPLSDHVEDAKQRLEALKKPIPAADPAAYERQKYEMDAYRKPGLWARSTDLFRRGPDTSMAAKSGAPAMATLRPPTPVSVPAAARAEEGSVTGPLGPASSDVTGSVVKDSSAIDSKPNQLQPGAGTTPAADGKTGTDAAAATAKPAYEGPPPTNHPNLQKRKLTKKQQKAQQDAQAAAIAAAKAAAKQDNVTAIPASSAPATGNTLPSAPTTPQ